ncbi:ABC transporter ATP-binding protein [Vagococcus zengguangii]|uniref:ABC transporter ATP-binding protein n=1 Tax=Vagococcus zengguangii TaxID=2571750 RepID=A0A4D7CU85_9ENTE|nr:ABC transporter ATP-binding protein [Vagococcus zengguangii]QCI85816.1 ABC transporter ATP-binding protein [Vagococcus zengguangii]TLG81757.1 ABC transporter ATP-binding protein [Vagococcus zengguangii]
MINAHNLSVTMNNTKILDDLNLAITPGECVIITGPSGSGKSTLINLLAGLIPELYDGQLTGKLTVGKQTVPPTDFYAYVEQLGVVFQNPKTQFFTSDVYSELAFPMENYGMERVDMLQRLADKTAELGLEPFIDRQMLNLSGGEKQLIAFTSSSMMPHSLFLLDEPSSNLDSQTQQKLLVALQQMKAAGVTIIIAEHRLDYLLPLADRFILMEHGKITKEFSAQNFQQLSNHELHMLGLRAIHPFTSNNTDDIALTNETKKAQVIQLESISYRYHAKSERSLSIPFLEFSNQEIIGIVGHNGAGKSTFSKLLTGLLKPKSGKISLNGKKLSKKALINQSFLVMQDVNLQLFFETVEKELTLTPVDGNLFDQVVEKLNLVHLLTRHPQTLSGGEKQRVAIASALLSGKQLIIFDEPTSGLDYRHMKEFSETLTWLRDRGVFVLVISHDQEFMSLACDRLLHFENGQLIQTKNEGA